MDAGGLASIGAIAALGLFLPCDDESGRPIDSVAAHCDVGKPPGYFVPHPADGPLAVLGCARLGVHGRQLEFSATLVRIDGKLQSCLNPAYGGRGRRGVYIPAVCKLSPPL